MRLLAITLSGSLLLSGCTFWPPDGRGGMAEHRPEALIPVMPDQPLTPQHGLRFELDLAQRHLDLLVLEGAALCFPATVVQAGERQNRITRELHGGLDFDAANDLIIQRNVLARLERNLDHVKQQEHCILPPITTPIAAPITAPVTTTLAEVEQPPVDIGKRIHELLNSDNQFAFDSSELNPKYAARLDEAALLLNDQPDYRLQITGHTDAVGDKGHNQKLSLERAHKVGDYLMKLGLDSGHIQIEAVGSATPLFTGAEPHVRLVNRRVTIELSTVADSVQATPR